MIFLLNLYNEVQFTFFFLLEKNTALMLKKPKQRQSATYKWDHPNEEWQIQFEKKKEKRRGITI